MTGGAASGGVVRLAAERTVDAPAEEIFDFLSDLDRHWLLGGRFVEVLELAGPSGARDGGVVRLRGPLGISRRVSTRVLESARPTRITGSAEIAAATSATVSWTLAPVDESRTHVELIAEVIRAGRRDRALLLLGGRWWLGRMLAATLATLGSCFERRRRR